MQKKRMIASIIEIVIGLMLCVAYFFGLLDEFWSGMGVALIVVGTIFFLRSVKYHTNADYRQQYDIAAKDERNRYLSLKAWAWAGYLFVMIAAILAIVFEIIGKHQLVPLASGMVCLMILLYLGSYMVLRRKY